jgi:uncharacterized membrane protein (UPF0182 family)
MRPPMPSMILSRRSKIALSVVAIIIVLLVVLAKLTGVYVSWLWFGQTGFHEVYRTILLTRLVLFAIFGVLMALVIAGNIALAYSLRPPFRPMSAEQQNLERYRVMIEPHRRKLLAIVAVISLLAAGVSAQGNWQTWQLWLHGGKFGVTDPQFHKDISFYMWDYPAYRLMLGFGFTAIIFAIILSALVHYLSGAIRLQTPGPKVTPAARRHLTVLVFVFMALKAVAYWLDRYGLVFSNRSKFTGASYTDVHSVLPSKTILFWIAIILALAVLASLWLRSPLLPGIGFVVLMVLSVLISGIYPAIVQQVSVNPNASTKEVPYIKRNIEATRAAYGLQTDKQVFYKDYEVKNSPPLSALSMSNPTVGDARLLDPNIISPTFTQQQQIRNVYGFADKLNVDRYTLPDPATGKPVTHDYVVGVRELDAANLSGNQANWINQHTNYTHGYGFVAAQANVDVTNDKTRYTESNIPDQGPLHLSPQGAQVYFGELLPEYSIVGAKGAPQEYNGSDNQKITYAGGGGVSLDSIFARLAFAVHYKQGNFVLNDKASAPGAKIIFNRNPRQMIAKVAPFLKVDGDPYPIVDQATGHIVWMVDGYTTSDDYPYSERQSLSSLTNDTLSLSDRTASQPNDTINYIRNSVKATVDAYTGKVTLYAWNQKAQPDPVLKAWMSVFPDLVKPAAAMPTDIRDHVRYPEDLFEVQRATLGMYHMNNPVTFYNVGDKWTVPVDPNAGSASQPPYYVLASPPGSGDGPAQFQLTTPMIVNGKQNLAAFISVDCDPGPNYGKLTVLTVPSGTVTNGPEQIANILNTNSVITKDLSLFNSAGGKSAVVPGNMLTLPIGDSFLYVEPLYVQGSEGNASFPTLQRVLLVYGDRIGYSSTFTGALKNLEQSVVGLDIGSGGQSDQPTSPPTESNSPSSSPSSSNSPSGSSNAPGGTTLKGIEARLNAAYQDLQNAYLTGNAAEIGAAQQKVNNLVGRLLQNATPGSSTGTSATKPRPSPTG